MPHINQRKYHSHLHKVKRLHHNPRHGEYMMINNLPSHIFDETSKYIKYFDYPLAQLLVDHSTNPLQNTTRQYIDQSINNSTEGRFKNHEMIIRRNGETTILRPKQDVVLANGFTPVIRPSSILPSYQSLITHPQVPSSSSPSSSLSIMNKMSIKKPEQKTIIKPKRKKDRYRRKRCHEKLNHVSKEFEQNNSTQSNFIHLFKQALHDMIEEQEHLPPPLMSILPEFHNPYNQSFPPRLEEPYFNRTSNFNEQSCPPLLPNNIYKESFYDFPSEQYRSFEKYHPPQQENICSYTSMFHQRHYTPMSGYFFN